MHFFFQGSSSMSQSARLLTGAKNKQTKNKQTESYHTNSTFLTLVASSL